MHSSWLIYEGEGESKKPEHTQLIHGGQGAVAPHKEKQIKRAGKREKERTWTHAVESRGTRCCSATETEREKERNLDIHSRFTGSEVL